MTREHARNRNIGLGFSILSVIFLGAFRLGNYFGFDVPILIRAVYLLCAMAFGARHAVQTRGKTGALRFTFAIASLSYAAEVIGVRTGWLFGHYAYGTILGPHLPGGVPVGIPVFWVLILYAADDLVGICLGPRSLPMLRILMVGALTAAWDLLIDPIAVAYGGWTWVTDAAPDALVFGIPATNAVGWWLVASVAIWVAGRPPATAAPELPAWYRHLPALAMVGAVSNNLAAAVELGFPAAGVAGFAALAPYFVVAASRCSWRSFST